MHNYEIHFKNIPYEQIDYLENHFINYTPAFAVIVWKIERRFDSLKIKFTTRKFFDADITNTHNDNLFWNLLGKDQFWSNIWFKFLNDDLQQSDIDGMTTYLVIDGLTKWKVDYSKYCSMEELSPSSDWTFEGVRKLKSFAEYVRNCKIIS